MKRARGLLGAVAVAFAFGVTLTANPISAGVIDTLPKTGDLAAAGSLAQGGTFVADDINLAEFTINIGMSVERRARPILLGTTITGEPTMGPVLWEGPNVVTPIVGDVTFTPNVPLMPGERYFLGLDYGFFTSVDGDIIIFSSRTGNPIIDGRAWRLLSGGWDPFSPNVDIGARIVMNAGSFNITTTEVKLLASDGTAGDEFGSSVSISGNVALVGAESDDHNGSWSGSAYVFRWNGSSWVEEQKLLASDGAADDIFGDSVSISGDVALVGASEEDKGQPGKAYVFRWNGSSWVQEQKLFALDGAPGDNFGQSVSISGDVALVGAEGDDDKGSWSGSAYVFRWNDTTSLWEQEKKLLASDGAANDRFGISVSISGDAALVGAYNSDGKSIDSGKAYVFRWNGSSWVQEQMLFASDGATDDGFGGSVTISGDMVLVGASEEEKGVPGSGMVYYFRWNDTTSLWEQKQKLLPSDGAAGDQFGQSVSISGEVALVGAEQIEFVPGKGKAYVFRWNGSSWVEKQKLFASDGAVGDRFGYSVSISGDVALVGAGGDDDKGSGSGSAYIYTPIDPCECDFDGDRDVDGLDLEAYISDQAGINLADCAGDLGRVDCPE